MKHSDRPSFPVSNIGSVTLLMIFIIVCMVAFAALSIATASSDYRAAEKTAAHTKAYYEASNEAEESYASIVQSLKDIYKNSTDETSYLQNVKDSFSGSDKITITEEESGLLLSYQTVISNRQSLLTELFILYPQDARAEDTLSTEALCTIRSWEVITTSDWEGDNSLKLLEME